MNQFFDEPLLNEPQLDDLSPYKPSVDSMRNSLRDILTQNNVIRKSDLTDPTAISNYEMMENSLKQMFDYINSYIMRISNISLNLNHHHLPVEGQLPEIIKLFKDIERFSNMEVSQYFALLFSIIYLKEDIGKTFITFLDKNILENIILKFINDEQFGKTISSMSLFCLNAIAKFSYKEFIKEGYLNLILNLYKPNELLFTYLTQFYDIVSNQHVKEDCLLILNHSFKTLQYSFEKRKEDSVNNDKLFLVGLNSFFGIISNCQVDELFKRKEEEEEIKEIFNYLTFLKEEENQLLVEEEKKVLDDIFELTKEKQVQDHLQDHLENDGNNLLLPIQEYILFIEFNENKKKIIENLNSLEDLRKIIFEKFNILNEEEQENVIIEFYDNFIKDYIELENLQDLQTSPIVTKMKLTKIIQTSNVIKNKSLQLVNDKYQILKRLGKGGFGTVFLANEYNEYNVTEDDNDSIEVYQQVALKYIEIESVKEFNRSLREGIQMLQLNHLNVAKVLDIFEIQSSDIGLMGVETKRYLCFSMPYYQHGDLYDLLKKGNNILTLNLIKNIMKQLLNALIYLHEKMFIVHRDIKPQNILIEQINLDNNYLIPVLSDFGLARGLIGKGMYSIAGTQSYMSPELQLHRSYDFKTDIWSMGVVFYQLLSLDFHTDIYSKIILNNYSNNGAVEDYSFLESQINNCWMKKVNGNDSEMTLLMKLKKLTYQMLVVDQNKRCSASHAYQLIETL
ncbi:hypothetical protein ABK040_013727 [Willaertia magna]